MKPSKSQTRVLIVDDEPLARDGLRMLLAEETRCAEILQANNGREAVATIRAERPDLVFLDVQMPEMDGFEVVREVGAANMPGVVFVTAHDKYAIEAFEINAIDYLLKPVTRERFIAAFERGQRRIVSDDPDNERVLALLETLASPPRHLSRLAIRSNGKTLFVEIDEVEWIEAAQNYVQLHVGPARHMLHASIQKLHASLDPKVFLRIHRSTIVNVRHVKLLEHASHGEYVFVLRSGVRLPSSRTYADQVRAWAENPF